VTGFSLVMLLDFRLLATYNSLSLETELFNFLSSALLPSLDEVGKLCLEDECFVVAGG